MGNLRHLYKNYTGVMNMSFYEFMVLFRDSQNLMSDILDEIIQDENFPIKSCDASYIRRHIEYVGSQPERVYPGNYFGVDSKHILKALSAYEKLKDLL